MSTISSQLLVTSSAITEDLYRTFFKRSASDKELVFVGRMAVLVIALVGCALAFKQNDTILALVGYAWAGFGSSFGPAILLLILETYDEVGRTCWYDFWCRYSHYLDSIQILKRILI